MERFSWSWSGLFSIVSENDLNKKRIKIRDYSKHPTLYIVCTNDIAWHWCYCRRVTYVCLCLPIPWWHSPPPKIACCRHFRVQHHSTPRAAGPQWYCLPTYLICHINMRMPLGTNCHEENACYTKFTGLHFSFSATQFAFPLVSS